MKRSKNGPETGPNSPKTGQNWPFLAARASGEQRTASEARGSTVPAIRKPHPALCHPGGSKVLRWLTFCSANDGRRATQEQPKKGQNSPKRGQNWPFLAARASGERRTASKARGSTVPAIRKPHPALCHPGGSRVLRWLTFCSAHDGRRATQEQAKNGPKRPKKGQNWPFLAARASGERRTACEARGSTVPAIRKPHPALCHPGGSRVLRWLTFCSALDGHRAMQEQAKNWPKRPKNGPKLAIFGCTSERRAADSERSERQHRPCYTKAPSSPVPPCHGQTSQQDVGCNAYVCPCLLACSCLVQNVEGRPKA